MSLGGLLTRVPLLLAGAPPDDAESRVLAAVGRLREAVQASDRKT